MSTIAATVKKVPRVPRQRKAVLSLTPTAVARVRALSRGDPAARRYLRVGVKSRGCSGLQYFLEEVTEKGKLDEEVKQDGVTVLVDSKALFSIIGSEMDWIEDRLSAKFVFNNPNVKDACGCGESFNVDANAAAAATATAGAAGVTGEVDPATTTYAVPASTRI